MVTGSSGAIGTGLSRKLIGEKYNVIAIDIKKQLWYDDIKTLKIDLRKNGLIEKKLHCEEIPETIVHLAANPWVHYSVLYPKLAMDNYLMVYNILEYARKNKVKNLIFSSSREVYGESLYNNYRKENETSLSYIKCPYSASKYGSEALIHSYSKCYGINSCIVRLSNVYGKYNVWKGVIPIFTYKAIRNQDLHVFGSEKSFDFTYIDDVINGLYFIIKNIEKEKDETFNICTGHSVLLTKVADLIINSLESRSKIVIDKKKSGEITYYKGDISKINKGLGYMPATMIEEGIKKYLSWYKEALKNKNVYIYQHNNLRQRYNRYECSSNRHI